MAVCPNDFVPVIELTVGPALSERSRSLKRRRAESAGTSGTPDSLDVTGGEYKARERIHRGMLIRDY